MQTIINTVFATVVVLAAAFVCATVVWAAVVWAAGHISQEKRNPELDKRRQMDLEELERRIM